MYLGFPKFGGPKWSLYYSSLFCYRKPQNGCLQTFVSVYMGFRMSMQPCIAPGWRAQPGPCAFLVYSCSHSGRNIAFSPGRGHGHARRPRNCHRCLASGLAKCQTVVMFGRLGSRNEELSSMLDVWGSEMRNCHRLWTWTSGLRMVSHCLGASYTGTSLLYLLSLAPKP